LEVIGLPSDKSELPISLFVGDDEHRNQEGLCHRIALKPFLGGRRVAIIDDADHLNQSSANCLLKTLEEPPPRSLLILIGTSPARQLPTIRSRTQIVRFRPLEPAIVAQILLDNGWAADREQAARLAALSQGSVERAMQLADPALWEFREQLLGDLAPDFVDGVRLARSVQAFVDDAGKEASLRRDRLRTVISFAMDYYRERLRGQVEREIPAHAAHSRSTNLWVGRGDAVNAAGSIECLEACLDALGHIERNANLALVVQNWCEQLAGSVTLRT
jgi:DNA polymerase-3 subunit delta'